MTINTKPDWLFEYSEKLDDGQTVQIEYDREGDTLELLFAEGSGRGVELSEEIVLRYDDSTDQPLSLILLGFSHLMQPTEYGPESYRLTGLERLPVAEREKILQILTSPPVDHYLRVAALALNAKTTKKAPIAFVRQQLAPFRLENRASMVAN